MRIPALESRDGIEQHVFMSHSLYSSASFLEFVFQRYGDEMIQLLKILNPTLSIRSLIQQRLNLGYSLIV